MLLQIHDMYPFTIRTIDKILIKNVHQKVQKIYTDVEKYLWIAHVQKVDSASWEESKQRGEDYRK